MITSRLGATVTGEGRNSNEKDVVEGYECESSRNLKSKIFMKIKHLKEQIKKSKKRKEKGYHKGEEHLL